MEVEILKDITKLVSVVLLIGLCISCEESEADKHPDILIGSWDWQYTDNHYIYFENDSIYTTIHREKSSGSNFIDEYKSDGTFTSIGKWVGLFPDKGNTDPIYDKNYRVLADEDAFTEEALNRELPTYNFS